ncbi:uncharacterized protein RCC_09946 [Ramularia collo-cygni]|uniref:Cytochrome P450 n=1 Tax=Ramularia collo-cygni TaxID=112498 RepID=A0A2D3VQ73_9PEZI|nr:uncharacterized protein RCC_09946 [Ramularia collo-cygni]CZT24228.1 uncharacterized protein RCC_09946 [Ramularia collo-cygni]
MSATFDLPNVVPTIGALVLFYITFSTFILPSFSAKHKFWKSQPWVGQSNQWFSGLRAQIRTIKDTRSLIFEGYEKYGKNNKLFILPQLLQEPLIILPSSMIPEINAMPDSRIDIEIPIEATLSIDRLIYPGIGSGLSVHFGIVRRQLTRRLATMTSAIHTELVMAMEREFPVTRQRDHRAVKVYPAIMKIVSQAANRAFCGVEVCRNPVFIKSSCDYAVAIFTLGGIMKMIPKSLHAPVHWTFKGMISRPLAACTKILIPVIHERLRHMQDPELLKSWERPYDALQWLLDEILEQSVTDPSLLNEHTIALRILNWNMASIHSTAITFTNTVLDLYSSPNAEESIASLREECERVLAAHGGIWTKDAVNDLIRVDSAIRESMRYSSILETVTVRLVNDPAGVTLSDGTHLPHGILIAFSQNLLHEDPRFYPKDTNSYNPFRFSAPRETYLAQASESGDPVKLAKVLEAKNEALIAAGPDFLGFGAGRHACPGRFFAAQEMKLALAHMLLSYDIKIEGGRPESNAINGFAVPSEEAEILIRLRE